MGRRARLGGRYATALSAAAKVCAKQGDRTRMSSGGGIDEDDSMLDVVVDKQVR